MTRPDAGTPDVCPICGSTLIERGHALYCASCDLVYEEDHPDSEENGPPRT